MVIDVLVGVQAGDVQTPKEVAHGLDSGIPADWQPCELLVREVGGIANGWCGGGASVGLGHIAVRRIGWQRAGDQCGSREGDFVLQIWVVCRRGCSGVALVMASYQSIGIVGFG